MENQTSTKGGSRDTGRDSARPHIDSGDSAVGQASDALSEVSQQMGERALQLGEAYRRFAETGRDYVRSSPATSVLVALAAGYGLSWLISSRRG